MAIRIVKRIPFMEAATKETATFSLCSKCQSLLRRVFFLY
nr:MAG TPA: hypothetical protein [Caudoviricetes sp.]